MNIKIVDGYVFQKISKLEAISLMNAHGSVEVCALFPDDSETEMENVEQVIEYAYPDVEFGISVGHLSEMVKLAFEEAKDDA